MYGLTSEDLDLRARARAFVADLVPHEQWAEEHGGRLPEDVDTTMRARARREGLVATNMPRDLGGGGCTMMQQVLVQEQVGAVTNALAWMLSTPPSWWVPVATEHQREHWLVPAVEGSAVECYAITEENAGSDVSRLEATARRTGDDYVLDGVKWHVTSYNEATYAFFQGRLVGGAHEGEHVLLAVDLPADGVRVVRTPAYSHTFAHHHPIVAFEGVRVPSENLVGEEGAGMTYSRDWFRFERFMVAARCIGAAERLIEEASAFASERVVAGGVLSSHQFVQGMLADSTTELFAARSMLYEAARGVDEGRDPKVQHAQASMAKLYASEMANRVADRAVEIFGGRGYMRENVAERYYRELRVERIWEGASEVQRVIIAAQLEKRGVRALA